MLKTLLFGMLVSTLAQAEIMSGGHDGGGGKGLICYGDKGEIVSAELLDFYEGRTLEGLDIPERSGTAAQIYLEVMDRSANESVKFGIMKDGIDFQKGFKFLPRGVRLNSIDDSSEIFVPKNCSIEQIANFQGLSRIFIVKDFWDVLSETSRAGLQMHEYLWYLERQTGTPTSSRARRTVARFFSTNYVFEPFEIATRKTLSCWTLSSNDQGYSMTPGDSFTIKKDEESNSCEFVFRKLNGATSFEKQVAKLDNCSFFKFFGEDRTNDGNYRGTSSAMQILRVFTGRDEILSHEIGLSMALTYDDVTHLPGRPAYRYQVTNKEFPGLDQPQQKLMCAFMM